MALITRTYTFTDGTTAYGSQVDSEISNIVNTLNNLDSAGTTWTNVKVTTLLPQADVNAGGHRITNLGTAIANGDALGAGMTQVIVPGMLVNNSITTTQMATGAIRGATANSGGYSGQEISLGTISTPDFRANAVTQQQSSVLTASSHNTDLTSITITTIGKPVLIIATLAITVNSDGSGLVQYAVDITQGNAAITGGHSFVKVQGQGATNSTTIPVSIALIDTPVAGTYTYKLSYNIVVGTFSSTQGYSLQAIELRA